MAGARVHDVWREDLLVSEPDYTRRPFTLQVACCRRLRIRSSKINPHTFAWRSGNEPRKGKRKQSLNDTRLSQEKSKKKLSPLKLKEILTDQIVFTRRCRPLLRSCAIRNKASIVAHETQGGEPSKIDHESRTGAGSVTCSRKEHEQYLVGISI